LEVTVRPDFRPIALTIVDFLGSFLPGCVWLLVIYEYDLMFHRLFKAPTIFGPMLHVLMRGDNADAQPAPGTAYYFGLAMLAVVLGFAVKPIVMRSSEWFSRPETWRRGGEGHRFPYKGKFSDKAFFATIDESVFRMTGFSSDQIPGTSQPFSTCKRILRASRTPLWDEIEHAEAEARMIGSLFLAVVVSVVPVFLSFQWEWILLWGLAVAGLGSGFRRARERETRYCYMNFLIALRLVDGIREGTVTMAGN
jgi:hypothetical protein